MYGNLGDLWILLLFVLFALIGGIAVIKSELRRIRRIMLLQLALQVDPDLMLDASSADKVIRNAAKAALGQEEEVAKRAKLFMEKQRRALSAVKGALKREKDALKSIRNDASASIKDMGLLMQSTLNEVQVMALRLKKEIESREKGDELRKTLKGQIEILEEEEQELIENRSVVIV